MNMKLNLRRLNMESNKEMELLDCFNDIKNKMSFFTVAAEKVGNKAAMTRARKHTEDMTMLLKKYRKLSLDFQKTIPIKEQYRKK